MHSQNDLVYAPNTVKQHNMHNIRAEHISIIPSSLLFHLGVASFLYISFWPPFHTDNMYDNCVHMTETCQRTSVPGIMSHSSLSRAVLSCGVLVTIAFVSFRVLLLQCCIYALKIFCEHTCLVFHWRNVIFVEHLFCHHLGVTVHSKIIKLSGVKHTTPMCWY